MGLGAEPTFDLAMSLNRLDLDLLSARLPDRPDESPEDVRGAAPGAEDDPEPDVFGGFRLPANINGTIELAAEAVLYNGQVVRQAVISASMIAGVLNLQRLSAVLPGGSDVTLFGAVDWATGTPRLIGQIEAVSDNLRAMLDWLEIDVSDVPADRLRKFGFSARVLAASQEVGEVSHGSFRYRLMTGVDNAT